MGKVLIDIPDETHAKIKHMAIDQGITATALIIMALEQYIPPSFENLPEDTSGPFTDYEKSIAQKALGLLKDVNQASYHEISMIVKPKTSSCLIRMLKVCIKEGYIRARTQSGGCTDFFYVTGTPHT